MKASRKADWLLNQQKNLHDQWSNQLFIDATLAQIQIDFAKFNALLQINNPFTLSELELEVEHQLNKISNHSPEKIPQLIYTIDLPEEIFNEIIRYSESVNTDIAKCIVVREAMKVYLRTKFSKA